MSRPFFITTAIDYTNGAPHIGHAYEKVLADVLARYHRLKGEDVFYLTGVDQHGQKVQQSAEKQGIPPQQFVDGLTAKFRALWEKLDVQYDGWAATTDALHQECVRANLQMLWDDLDPATGASRWIYKKSEGGYYSVRQEQFLTDKERGADGEFGPEWQPVEFREEENFYFRLKEHQPWLLDFIDRRSAEGNPFVVPDFRVAELRNAVEKIEGDLCISRPASRLQWGIPFPESFGAGFVTYVWFDALVNYITFVPGHDAGFNNQIATSPGSADSSLVIGHWSFPHWWPALHVIGKDIMIPAHGVYWPIMLKALGFPDAEMPTLLVHGWWNISGEKMSKSLGNIIDPNMLGDIVGDCVQSALKKQQLKDAGKGKSAISDTEIGIIVDRCGPEALRYYLMSDISRGKDADFDLDRFLVERYNGDLANKLGNLLNRSLSMTQLYCSGRVTFHAESTVFVTPDDTETYSFFRKPKDFVNAYVAALDEHRVDIALGELIRFAEQCNAYIELSTPWRHEKEGRKDFVVEILYTLAESLRIIALLISPVLPKAAAGIFDQLNWKMDEQGKESRFCLADATWGQLPDGHQLGQPTPLFPRIEAPKPAE